jgi:ABC-type glucose/galactose transport system permease subunit
MHAAGVAGTTMGQVVDASGVKCAQPAEVVCATLNQTVKTNARLAPVHLRPISITSSVGR